MMIDRRGVLAATTGLALPALARAQTQYKAEYKVTVVGSRALPFGEGAGIWCDLVTERTAGRITMKLYPGSQLVGGDQTRELVAMRQGVAEMGVFSTINLAPQIREMSLFQLPFLIPDHRAFDALISGEAGADLFRVLATRDVVPLAWGENGFRELSNSRRAVRRPEDLRGLKIRFAAGAIFAEIFNAMGANPLQMSFADLQPALSTGAVDGQENSINGFLGFRMDTLGQRHMTVWNYTNDPIIFTVSKAVWDSFAPADREVVRAAAQEAATRQIALTRAGTGAPGTDRASFDELKRRNVDVQELTAAEKAAFATATRPVYEKWASTVGRELVTKAERAIAARA